MATKVVLADARSLPGRPLRSDVSTPEAAVLFIPGAALMVIVLLSLGLWAAIWLAVTMLVSLW